MSNADTTSGSTDRRLRVPRLLMVISALLLFGAIGYFSTRETSPAPSAEVPKDLAARFEAVE